MKLSFRKKNILFRVGILMALMLFVASFGCVFGPYRGSLEKEKQLKAVSIGTFHYLGLKENGTVIAEGFDEYGVLDVRDWKDIVAIAAGDHI